MNRYTLATILVFGLGCWTSCLAQTNDFPDVTLEPWTVGTIDFSPSGTTHCLTSSNGLVVLYNPPVLPEAQLSTNFGVTWEKISQLNSEIVSSGGATLTDYIPEDSTAFAGNGYFLATLEEAPGGRYVWTIGLMNANGDLLQGFGKMAFGGGLLIGIQAYSTYVSADRGATWTPYLNPWMPDESALVSFNRIYYDGAGFVAVAAKGTYGYSAFQGSTWRSSDGVTWREILATNAVAMDSQGRLVAAAAGEIYDLAGDNLVAAHAEFPTATGSIDYYRIGGRIYTANGQLLYYSDDKGVTRYVTGFPAAISAIWTKPTSDGQYTVEVLLSDKRLFSSAPVKDTDTGSSGVTLDSIQLRPMLTFEAPLGATVIIEASTTPNGPWSEVARLVATGAKQVWNDNRDMANSLFYRARTE